MLKLGVTGGIGSGKTTFCQFLEEDHGARVFYADPEAKRLMVRPDIRDQIEAAFPGSYFADGTLDNAALARAVFGDADALVRLNGIVHPRVAEALAEAVERAEAEGAPLFAYESALLLQSGAESRAALDAVVALVAPPGVRAERAAARDAAPEAAVRKRMAHQLSDETLRARADYIVENTGDLSDLRESAAHLVRTLGARK